LLNTGSTNNSGNTISEDIPKYEDTTNTGSSTNNTTQNDTSSEKYSVKYL
jgi:hypothetical protein